MKRQAWLRSSATLDPRCSCFRDEQAGPWWLPGPPSSPHKPQTPLRLPLIRPCPRGDPVPRVCRRSRQPPTAPPHSPLPTSRSPPHQPFLSLAANSSLLGGGGGEWTLPAVWAVGAGCGGRASPPAAASLPLVPSPAAPSSRPPLMPQPFSAPPTVPPISPSLPFISAPRPLGLAWAAISVDKAGRLGGRPGVLTTG